MFSCKNLLIYFNFLTMESYRFHIQTTPYHENVPFSQYAIFWLYKPEGISEATLWSNLRFFGRVPPEGAHLYADFLKIMPIQQKRSSKLMYPRLAPRLYNMRRQRDIV